MRWSVLMPFGAWPPSRIIISTERPYRTARPDSPAQCQTEQRGDFIRQVSTVVALFLGVINVQRNVHLKVTIDPQQ